jgi:transposase
MNGEHATIEQDGPIRSGHKGSHMTTPPRRIEVITGGERRRRWSIEEKREIVAESLGPEVRLSEIIRKHGITSGQLYAWRQQLTRRVAEPSARVSASFARVEAASGEEAVRAPETPAVTVSRRSSVVAPAIVASRAKGVIEIVLPDGTSVRVDAHVDDRALRYVLDALRAR